MFDGFRVWQDEKVLEGNDGDGFTTMWIYLMLWYI